MVNKTDCNTIRMKVTNTIGNRKEAVTKTVNSTNNLYN